MTVERLQYRALRPSNTPLLSHHVGRAHDFVLTAGMTPHDPDRGTLVSSVEALPEETRSQLQSGIYFVDSQLDRVKAQTWQALKNLSDALAAFDTSFDKLVHLRVFLRDIRDEPAVLDVLQRVVGELPSGEIVEAWNPGAPTDIDVQIDAIAVASNVARTNIRIAGLDNLSAPFALATRGGDLMFSSCLPGADPKGDALLNRLANVAPEERALAKGAVGPLTRRVEAYMAQQLALWHHFHTLLANQNIPRTNLLLNFMWVRRSMREMADGYINRHLLRATGSKHCLTTFPTANLRYPDALVEGRIVAVYPDAKRPKEIKIADHERVARQPREGHEPRGVRPLWTDEDQPADVIAERARIVASAFAQQCFGTRVIHGDQHFLIETLLEALADRRR